jgi:hypothetical protein
VDGVDSLVQRRDERLGRDGREVPEHLDLHAGGEGAAGARHHGHPYGWVARESVERRAQLIDEIGDDQIERRTVERDPRAALLHLDAHQRGHGS